MLIMNLLLLGQIKFWIVINRLLPNFFVRFRFVNILPILIYFKHVGQSPELDTETFRSRSVPIDTLF